MIVVEINATSNILRAALDQYLKTCSTVRNNYTLRGLGTVHGVPTELIDCVSHELRQIALYKVKIQEAKAAISAARNDTPAIVPIHILPTEILVRIFYLAIDLRCCSNVKSRSRKITSPVDLSYVCSCWREIAMEASTLWSHVDVNLNFSLSGMARQRIMSYTEARVTRARQSPLETHIFGSFPSQLSVNSLLQLLVPVAARIGSLSLELGANLDPYIPLLLNYFANCMPGTLKQLSLLKTAIRKSNVLTFITAAKSPHQENLQKI